MKEQKMTFASEEVVSTSGETSKWKILIVDDEREIHRMTSFILRGIEFENKEVEFISAYSGEEAKKVMANHTDTAVILLDVVMEHENSGLEVAKHIRRDLKNSMVRMILRTGQPGQAPERKVISEYDINDYKEKTELTAQKLYTTIISSLRSYRDLKKIDENKRGLEKVIKSSRSLFKKQSLAHFTAGLLAQLSSILNTNDINPTQVNGFATTQVDDQWTIAAALGRYERFIGRPIVDALPPTLQQKLSKTISEKKEQLFQKEYIGYFASSDLKECILYIEGSFEIDSINKNLLDLFSANINIALDNIMLNDKIIEEHRAKIEMQRGVLMRLNEVIGLRSKETGNHVKRVAAYSCLLAREIGLSEEEIEIINIASLMHDVGKVGIPDSILLKPSKLTEEEYEAIKHHTSIGAKMLFDNNSQLLKASATIAKYHHEKWDGNGYPYGLKSEDIPLLGRITAICDVFDALVSKRCYKAPWSLDNAFGEIEKNRGTAFDPNLVDIFLKCKNEVTQILETYADD